MKNARLEKKITLALKRTKEAHKGSFGKLFVVAGSPGLTGAAYLTCMGALRAGAGLVRLGIPRSLNPIMEIKLTEAMTQPLAETKQQTLSSVAAQEILSLTKDYDVIAAGPGISTQKSVKKCIERIVVSSCVPLVLDADALNVLKGGVEILAKSKSSVIITPHPGEFSRLFGVAIDELQRKREYYAEKMARSLNITVVLKGYETVVASPKKTFINHTGNAGMATGGSGDILTGMIAAFVGQGISEHDAACFAVYLHGRAGDIAEKEKTQISLLPSDILDSIPYALRLCGIR